MEKQKQTKAAEIAALETQISEAKNTLDSLPETATETEKTELEATVFNLERQLAELANLFEKVEVKFLKSPTGKYKLGYNIGDTATVASNVADEMVATEWAEYVK